VGLPSTVDWRNQVCLEGHTMDHICPHWSIPAHTAFWAWPVRSFRGSVTDSFLPTHHHLSVILVPPLRLRGTSMNTQAQCLNRRPPKDDSLHPDRSPWTDHQTHASQRINCGLIPRPPFPSPQLTVHGFSVNSGPPDPCRTGSVRFAFFADRLITRP
jgi:hypothetical protein